MKIGFDKKKSAEALAALAQSTTEISKKVADGVKSNTALVVEKTKISAAAVAEKTKNDAYARRLKKYNPLFPDKYFDESYNVPNIIVIVDDAVRKDIDVCEGAIGWTGKEKDVEVLYLYDEAVPTCGLQFIPAATCDAVYYVDSFDRKSFIKADSYFRKVQEERSAELEHIACSLGAKWCSIEIVEKEKTAQAKNKKSEFAERFKGIKTSESAEQSASENSTSELRTKNYSEFQGNNIPQRPNLKWFAHDSTIRQLIAARCSGDNSITKKTMEFYGSAFTTMSKKAACAIDCALVTLDGASGNTTMEAQATKEQESTLVFQVEF